MPDRPNDPSSQRCLFGVLVLACVLMLSGNGLEPPPAARLAPPAESAPRAEESARAEADLAADRLNEVDLRLASVNPSLSARERARIGAALYRYSEQYGLDPDLVLAVMLVESDARPWAHSPAGAVGLMQVMPHMMRPMALAGNLATIESNIEAGCRILSSNIRRLGLERGISAYFWGSNIRGVAYLEKVLEARERVRLQRAS